MAGITNDYYLNTSKYKYTTEKDNSKLGKDAFLQILITQLQNQDPTNPMDDREFIAQMAQFSSLEQMQNMTKAVENLVTSQQETQLMSYTGFIGKQVKWTELTEEKDEKGNPKSISGTGAIVELKFKDGQPVFVLEGGKEIGAGNISSILASTSGTNTQVETNPFVEASQLIGQTVTYTSNEQTVESIIDAITQKNGVIEYVLTNGDRLPRNMFEILNTNG